MDRYFGRGEVVQLRGLDIDDQLEFQAAVRVVEDGPNRTVLYTPVGTPMRGRGRLVDRVLDPSVPIDLSPLKWQKTEFVGIYYPDSNYSVWVMWKMPERVFQCWYVNIESPIKRFDLGFVTTDLTLDVVVRPDLSWYWKDEDELKTLVDVGYYSGQLADEIRSGGLAAIDRLKAGQEPFSEQWQDWQPDPAWKVPEFPYEWEENSH